MWVLIVRESCLLVHILPIRYHIQNVAYEGAYTHLSLSSLCSGGPSLLFPRAIPQEFNPQSLQNPSSLGAAMTNLIACFVESKPIIRIRKDVSIQTDGWSNKRSRYPAPRLNIPMWQVIEQKRISILLFRRALVDFGRM